jgi:hypothetical protein
MGLTQGLGKLCEVDFGVEHSISLYLVMVTATAALNKQVATALQTNNFMKEMRCSCLPSAFSLFVFNGRAIGIVHDSRAQGTAWLQLPPFEHMLLKNIKNLRGVRVDTARR